MIRLIAFDLDGTLLDPAGEITPETVRAIARARENGVRVVIATGRSDREAADFARRAGCDGLAVCVGGAVLTDTATLEQLRRWDMPWESGRRALELCLGRGIELMLFAGDRIVLDPFSSQSLRRTFPFPVFHEAAVVAEDPIAYLEQNGLPLTKIHADQKPGGYPREELAALPGVELTASNGRDCEVIPAGVSKGRALALLAALYGVPLAECAAVGDNENDLSMLEAVGTPIAMGNATQAVKRAAKYVCASNGQEGAASAIRYILEQNGTI